MLLVRRPLGIHVQAQAALEPLTVQLGTNTGRREELATHIQRGLSTDKKDMMGSHWRERKGELFYPGSLQMRTLLPGERFYPSRGGQNNIQVRAKRWWWGCSTAVCVPRHRGELTWAVLTGHTAQSLPAGKYTPFQILTLLLGIKCDTTENHTKDQAMVF